MAGWAYSHRTGDEAAFRGELTSVLKLWHNPLHHHRASSRLCEHTPHNLDAEGSLLCRSVWTAFPRGHLPQKWRKRGETLVFFGASFLCLNSPQWCKLLLETSNMTSACVCVVFCTTVPVSYKFLIRIGLQGFLYNSKYCNHLYQTHNVLQKLLLQSVFFFNKIQ